MTFYRFLFLLPLFVALAAHGQVPAIGQWRAHLPSSNAVGVADGGSYVIAATELAAFRYNKSDGSIERLNTVNVLSDIGVSGLYQRPGSEQMVLVYDNSNIDVLNGDAVFNFPFIRTANIVGDKSVRDVGFRGDSAYLACGFGVVVLNLETEQSPATYFFATPDGTPIGVNAVRAFGGSLYAATEEGMYRADANDPLLEEFSRWDPVTDPGLPTGAIDGLFEWNGVLNARIGTLLLSYDGTGWVPWYDAAPAVLQAVQVNGELLLLTEHFETDDVVDSARILVWDGEGLAETVQESVLPVPQAVAADADGSYWVADLFRGLVHVRPEGNDVIVPNGPASAKAYAMDFGNGYIYVAPGDVNGSWNRLLNRDGFFRIDEFGWANLNGFNLPALDSIGDILALSFDPYTNDTWLGSFGDGLLQLSAEGELTVYKHGFLQNATGDPLNYRVAGVHYDPITGHVWVANNGAAEPILVKEYQTDNWYRFPSGLPASAGEALGPVLTDEFGQVWYIAVRGNGMLVYDPGQDLASPADDRRKVLGLGAGNGNLPNRDVKCMVRDLDGEIWIGTAEGIAVFYNPSAILEPGTAGDAAQIVVELDGFPAILFEEEIVNALAIDGANRKWLGTENGVFLISEDGLEQLAHFTESNSPLLSNSIQSIAVSGETGEVFFGTANGIVSYRGEATQGGETHQDVYVFPNPVREDFNGPIAIRGLVQDADVKITDARGRLVYETTALGGQAVWDGRLVGDGSRARTGVYIVYSTDAEGNEKFATKFLMVSRD